MLRLTSSSARAFHAAVVALAAACGPAYQAQTTSAGASLLCDGEPVASSAPLPESPAQAIETLRDSVITLGLLPLASLGQHQRLIRLYNHALASRDEKRALLSRLHRLRADEAEQLYVAFSQELKRRGAGEYAVSGEAYKVAA